MKELVAVRRGILRFANDLRGHTVCLYEDNQTVVAIIKNRTSSSPLLMNELRLLMALLEQLDIRLVPRYIRSELNPADIFSRLTDRDAWTLSPSVQRMLMQRAQAMFRKNISLDAFACPQSKVTYRLASRHFAPEALAEDGAMCAVVVSKTSCKDRNHRILLGVIAPHQDFFFFFFAKIMNFLDF
jgi:hypothetical protein